MLTIEDGTIVAGANSYVSVDTLRAYAADRGITLPEDDAVVAAYLVAACDYIESRRDDFKGDQVDVLTQPLCWPRSGVILNSTELPSTTIPSVLKFAQFQLAIEKSLGTDLLPTSKEPFIVKEEVGPLKTTYSENIQTSDSPTMRAVEAWLKPLLRGASILTTVRI